MDRGRQLNLDDELDIVITEDEVEYTSDSELMDAREALSDLKKKHFDKC
ncbi:MAG: hypothetical protein ABFD25_10345 [Clostridiaceae bacterium]